MKQEPVLARATCSYENLSQKFIFTSKRKFNLQYSHLYATRFNLMKPKLVAAAKDKWGGDVRIKHLVDLVPDEQCVIVGILFRKMELQPGMLKEICDEENVLPLPVTEKYACAEDQVILEEQQQRIQLIGDVDLPCVVTGLGMAVLGYEVDDKFYVKETVHSLMPAYGSPGIDQCLQDGEDRFVLFLSGLGIGSVGEDQMRLQLLIDLVSGRLGSEEDNTVFAKVCRVVIAGNSLSKDLEDKDTEKQAKYLSRNVQARSVVAMEHLNNVLVEFGSCVPTDVMPGDFDPTNQFLPQQPLHKCMFPAAIQYSTVQSVCNPYKASVGGLKLLGTSGQNVSNIYQYSGFTDRLDILEATLKGGHISPTCPDTLSCYPYYDKDPFVLEECPDIYFAGNQPEFGCRKVKNSNGKETLLLLVPTFHLDGVAVLVNLRDMSAHRLDIDTSFE